MIHVSVYVPVNDVEKVKAAMFKAGAGKIGLYENCCFEIPGRGQFKPLEGSRPTIGRHLQVEFVEEVKLEMVVRDELLLSVIAALKEVHPYETPAYHAFKVLDV